MATVLTTALRSIISCCSRTENQDCYSIVQLSYLHSGFSKMLNQQRTSNILMVNKKSCDKPTDLCNGSRTGNDTLLHGQQTTKGMKLFKGHALHVKKCLCVKVQIDGS
uniref:Uncharacterized protein n=1 Tax=Romanomermis culicivorax TaxID=13658 RepID=A0A915JJS5_ROMCU